MSGLDSAPVDSNNALQDFLFDEFLYDGRNEPGFDFIDTLD